MDADPGRAPGRSQAGPGPLGGPTSVPAGRGAHSALVLFSGGQDSTACLAWALARPDEFDIVHTVGFDYGQRHRIELDCRLRVLDELRRGFPDWATRLGTDQRVDATVLQSLGDSALTAEREIALRADGLPNTFVPGRNLLFLTLAAALADRLGATTLVGGMCQTDYSGYPDCRDDTLQAMQRALSLGLGHELRIATPLMWLDKADTWALTQELGGDALTGLVAEHTHTCYLGERGARQAWGHGCGQCPACALRARGWQQWQVRRTARPA